MPIQQYLPARFYANTKNQIAYRIEGEVGSPATHIIFTHNEAQHPLCLKFWKVCHNGLYEIEDPADGTKYHLEGLPFNRQFAPGIYLGLTPVKGKSAEEILCGRIMRRPTLHQLEVGVEYALVMKRIDWRWSLAHELEQGGLDTKTGMEFLAREVARMHRKLKRSEKDKGTPESIAEKLTFNKDRFMDALQELASQDINTARYSQLSKSIDQAYTRCEPLFRQRHRSHAIKRCHGDLKISNLWIRPESRYLGGLILSSSRLLALDCIDFNPEFYHIDTLSDIAMLAIDIEMHLGSRAERRLDFEQAKTLSRHLLDTYLREVQEDLNLAWKLLTYYIVEKAMVCAYVQLMHDLYPEASLRYLDLGFVYAQQL